MRIHQEISGEIYYQIRRYLDGKKCKVYAAPFVVRLFEKEGDSPDDVHTVVEPDITVICDPNKLDKHGCKGAPDMVIEILSPSTPRYDSTTKLNKYLQADVKEYWIVNPDKQTVHVFCFDDCLFTKINTYESTDTIEVTILNDCFIELSRVFPKEEIK